MRDLIRALSELETRLEETYGITLNEAMVLCAVGKEIVSAGDVTSRTGMTSSHASKTIRSVEDSCSRASWASKTGDRCISR